MVGHLGENGTTDRWTSDNVIKNTTGINVLIDGHSHEEYGKYVKNKEGQDVLLTQTGTKLKNFGKLTLHTDGTISNELVSQVPAGAGTSAYTVKNGDSLSRIAKRELGSYNRWNEIYEANRDKIKDPNVLTVGVQFVRSEAQRQTLVICLRTHTAMCLEQKSAFQMAAASEPTLRPAI